MKKKILKISGIVLGILLLIAMIALVTFKVVDLCKYGDFYGKAEKEFYIPGLLDGFVPQGFDYVEDEKVFLACGYMTSGASRIYVIDEDGENYRYVELYDIYGKEYTGHTGGIAYYSSYVYITGDNGIDVFPLKEILDKNSVKAVQKDTIETKEAYGLDPAFCFIYDGQLFAGTFHDNGIYKDPERNKIHQYGQSLAQRDDNNAIMIAFDIVPSKIESYCISSPVALYSLPDKVQGICVTDDEKLVLSTSYGLEPSNIYVHSLEKIHEQTYSAEVSKKMIGANVPLYVIDSKTLVDTIVAPPMSEEIVYLDGKLWIMNESASNKYVFGKFTTGNYLFSYAYPQPIK